MHGTCIKITTYFKLKFNIILPCKPIVQVDPYRQAFRACM